MENLSVYTLFSGSKGNCAYIKYRDSEILIDAGVCETSIRLSLESIGTSLDNISDIFVTHDHTDHTRGLEMICKKHNVKVHMTARSASAVLDPEKTPNLMRACITHEMEFCVKTGELEVRSFVTPHDSAASVGYVINTPKGKLAYATDIGHISDTVRENLCGAEAVILESNHDIEMLKEGVYPDFLKRRILSRFGHLSNDDCAELAAYLAENGTKRFVLAHLSAENNLPEMAFSSTLSALGDIKHRGIYLAIAEPDHPTRLV